MGIDQGFDLYPPFRNTDSDNKRWAEFLAAVVAHYKSLQDENMTVNAAGDIIFTQGEHPTLLRKGYRFRRFSSKISGRHADKVGKYLEEVWRFAVQHFGDGRANQGAGRTIWWSELCEDDEDVYSWTEVHAARKGEMDDDAAA